MGNETDFWVIRPFNTVFLITFAAFLLLLLAASILLRGKRESTRQTVLVIACLATLVGFFFYKYYLSQDADFNVITADMGGFNWWGELPLQLCNINMLLIPVAVWTKKRPLLSFCFFVAPLGALMALVMPGIGFSGCSIWLPRMLGYFGTRFMVFIMGIAVASFGLFRPRLRDLPLTMLALLVIAFVIFCIDMLLRVTGLYANANYFYAVETEGNFLLELFHSWLPWPFLFLLPSLVLLGAYAAVITLGFELAAKLRPKSKIG